MIGYIGGKSKISTWIKEFIPTDIETYVEPFSGMYWLFFKLNLKEVNFKNIVYNDINPLNYNLFRCIKDYNKLWEISRDIPIENKEIFDSYKLEVFNSDIDVSTPNFEIAYKYAYVLSQVWSGTDPFKGNLIKNGGYIGKDGIYKSKFEIFRSKLKDDKWNKYFDRITNIENLDFSDVIEKYDSPKTFFYCDPPYFKTEEYYINHNFDKNTHEKLSDCLKSINGKFALSYYEFDELNEWFPRTEYNWHSKGFSKLSMARPGKKLSKSVELLICNY